MERSRVYVDSREGRNKKLIEELRKFEDLEVLIRALPTDMLLSGERGVVLIERKTISDFISSVEDRRIWSQVKALKRLEEEEGARTMLIVSGFFGEGRKRKGRTSERREGLRRMILSTIASIMVDWGIPVLRVESTEQVASFVRLLAKRLGKPVEAKPRLLEYKPKARSPDDEALRIISSFPGVSAVLADKILRRFKSVENVIKNAERLDEVEGIGKEKKERILRALRHLYKGELTLG